MSWRDTEIEADDDAPHAPLKITVPTQDNLEKAMDKQDVTPKSWRDTEADVQSTDTGIPFISEFKHGVEDLGSLGKDAVKSVYAFAHGEAPDLGRDETPMADTLRQKRAAGTDDRHDYERAFLEGMGNSPGGKMLGAIGGILPEANIVNTITNRWANPTISKITGIDPAELQLGEMAALPVASKVLKSQGKDLSPSDLPITSRAVKIVTNPIETAGKTVQGAMWPLKQAARPFVRGMIDIDNPFTGGQGLEKALKSSTALEGERLGDKLGINFSAGELTGNSSARGIEDTLANSSKWGQKFSDANTAKTDAIVGNFNKVLDGIYGQETVPEDFGSRLSTSYNSTTDSLYKNRRAQAAIDFGAAYEGADEAGQYIPSNNLFRELYDIRQEGDARLLTKSKASGAKLAKTLLSKIGTQTAKGNEMATPLSIKELGNGLSDFGEEAANKELPDAERRTYARLYSALQKDLDAEIVKPHGDPQKTAMLAVARDNFKSNSDQISDLQKTVLGNVIGGAAHDTNGNITISPESLADKFTTLPPSQLRQTLKFLDDNHPDVANMGRRYVLERALSKAQEGVGLRGVGTTKQFAKADFAKLLPEPAKLNALLGDGKAYNDVMDIAAATNRLIDWGASQKGSQTFQRGNIFHSLYDIGKGALIKSIVSDNLARDLLDPAKRKQMALEAPLYQKALKGIGKAGVGLWNDQGGQADIVPFRAMKDRLGEMKNASGPRGGVFSMDQYKAQPNPNMGGLGQVADEQMQSGKREPLKITVPTRENLQKSEDKRKWILNNTHPDMVHNLEKSVGRPIENWSDGDVNDLYNDLNVE